LLITLQWRLSVGGLDLDRRVAAMREIASRDRRLHPMLLDKGEYGMYKATAKFVPFHDESVSFNKDIYLHLFL